MSNNRSVFAVLAVGVGAYALLQGVVTPVLPTIQAALHTSQTNVTWVLTAYLLSASIFTPIVGRLGDMRGKKKMFVIALIALVAGSLIAALATTLPIMILARVVQGIGGGVLPLAFGIIRDEFPSEKVGGAVGLIASITAVGVGVGTVLAGPIVAALNYHWLFWIPLIMVAAAALAGQFLIPESRETSQGKINWLTAILMSAWLVALLVAVSQAPSWGWGSVQTLGLLAIAVVLLVAWIILESRSKNPLIDMRMMAIRSVWTTNLAALLFGVAMYGLLAFLPDFLQTSSSAGYGFSASITAAGIMLLPQAIFMFIVGLVAGRLGQRHGSKRVLIAGSLVGTLAFIVLALAHDQAWEIYLATSLTGIGFGLAFASMSGIIVNAVRREQTGVASGMNANIRTIGGSLGAAIMGSVVTARLQPSGIPAESGYTHGFLLLAGVILLSAIAAVFIPAVARTRVGSHLEEAHVDLQHAELALVPGGTLVGDESE